MIINRKAPEGNAFVIMGYVRQILKLSKREAEWPTVRAKMESGNYENLCKVATEATYGVITFTDEDDE